jgi:hypothetical protein
MHRDFLSGSLSLFFAGTREQENVAVNTELVNLLALLKNDTEPFLLFLYVYSARVFLMCL